MEQCAAFLEQWTDDPMKVKPVFERFETAIKGFEGVEPSFKARPGISFSLRGCMQGSSDPFVIVDVVDDDPENRWLSVCFYDAMITDPEERGDWVPEGLGGQDARCFDVEGDRDADYVRERINEAWRSVSN